MEQENTSARRLPAWMSGDGDALGQAVSFVVVPLLFGLFGRWLDHVFGTVPFLMLGFGVLGVVGMFVAVYYRYQARMAELDEGQPWARRA
ncbi:MAG: AtpZ/AtpI family protein [Acidimicrobiia bacterium]